MITESGLNPQILPSYAIIDYAWDVLQENTDMTTSDYNGKIPITPASQQPEFTDIDKPFLVYAWSENDSGGLHVARTGQMSFAVYGRTDREISHIANLLTIGFGRYDMSAENVNQWKIGKPYSQIRFMTFWATTLDGPTPERTEAGRQSAVVIIRYRYVVDYAITLPGTLP